MKIIKTMQEYSKRELYYFTQAPNVQKMSEKAGETILLDGFVLYDVASDDADKERKVLCVRDKDGNYYGTNSATFIKAFMEIVDLFAEDDNEKFEAFTVHPGVNAKNGREFITCLLA